jgi:glycosyltransferase involved in cell wall biosynthesis
MTSKLPISVFIIAKNEQDRIAASIKSVDALVNEVIVIDSGSNDDTKAIVEKLGVKFIYNEWKGYVAQKVYGESICRNKWILNIDADEEISPKFAGILPSLIKESSPKAYICRMVILHRFDKSARAFAPDTRSIRLYHVDYAGFKFGDMSSKCHDSVVVSTDYEGKIGFINEPIFHRSIKSINQAVEKANFYSSMQADELYDKGRGVSIIRIILEPFWWFLKAYIFRRYFVYGFNGFVDSVIFAFTKFIRLAKLREKRIEKNLNN